MPMALENSLSTGLVLGTRNPLGVSVPFSLREARNLASAGGEQEHSSLTSLPNLISPTPSLGSCSSRGILASTIGLLLLCSSWPKPLPFNPFYPSLGTQDQLFPNLTLLDCAHHCQCGRIRNPPYSNHCRTRPLSQPYQGEQAKLFSD